MLDAGNPLSRLGNSRGRAAAHRERKNPTQCAVNRSNRDKKNPAYILGLLSSPRLCEDYQTSTVLFLKREVREFPNFQVRLGLLPDHAGASNIGNPLSLSLSLSVEKQK
jgi:hypothetical protein